MNKGLKIDNSASALKPAVQVPNFRDKVHEILQNEDLQNKIAGEVVGGFLSVINDKTLDSAKSLDDKNNDRKKIEDLIDFARIANSNEEQESGLGTTTVLIVLCRTLLKQRDRINELEFSLNKLSSQFKSSALPHQE